MLEILFENRNKTISSMIKLGDLLGRSLRENVTLLSIDGNSVSYLVQDGKIISGIYESTDDVLKLKDIKVEDSTMFSDKSKVEDLIKDKISNLIESIQGDNLSKADTTFKDVINFWDIKANFNKRAKEFNGKLAMIKESTDIINSVEFLNLIEVTPELTKFLKENKESILKVSEIINGVKLSNIIAEAFNIKLTDYDSIFGKSVEFNVTESNDSVYEMICRQELIKKELLESKKNFDSLWATNDKIQNLVGAIYADKKEVEKCIVEAVTEIPYFALASKKELYNTINHVLDLTDDDTKVPDKDVKRYVSELFETKKPIRRELVRLLTEKYGINIGNLKAPPSFNSLLNTQVVVFESLARLSPKKSVQREVLSNFAKSLKDKNGIHALDVNDYLQDLFTESKYSETVVENASLMKFLDFGAIGKELGDVTSVIQMLKAATGQTDQGANTSAAQGGLNGGIAPHQGEDGNSLGSSDEGGEMGTPAMDADEVPQEETNLQPEGQPNEFGQDQTLNQNTMPVDLNQLALQLKELEAMLGDLGLTGKDLLPGEEEYGEAGEMPVPEEGMEGGEGLGGPEGMEGEEGMGEEGQPSFGEEGEEEEGGEEGNEGEEEVNINTGSGDDDVHVDVVNGEHDMDSDDEEPKEKKPKAEKKEGGSKPKGKGFPPKKEGK